MIYLVDIDGTLAELSHRLHFIEQKPANWDGFFAACGDDLPIPEVIEVVRSLKSAGNTVILVSGRSDAIKDATAEWLMRYNIPFDDLFMRKAGDHRADNIVKDELLHQLCLTWDRAQIGGVFEDRKQVVDMYRAKGLRVFQVADGNF